MKVSEIKGRQIVYFHISLWEKL